jgi:hypothetical protein
MGFRSGCTINPGSRLAGRWRPAIARPCPASASIAALVKAAQNAPATPVEDP